MIKKQQKWIALLVTLTFMWLLQVSTMPLAAANTTEQVSSANEEHAPSFIEQEGSAGYQAKKKSILPLVLIGVGVVAVAAVLILVVFKTKYDITGKWDFVFTQGAHSESYTLTFTGTKASGNYSFSGTAALSGTYTVEGKNVAMFIPGLPAVQFSGQFTDKDAMNGTMINGSDIWNWTATRNTATATLHPTPAMQSKLFPK